MSYPKMSDYMSPQHMLFFALFGCFFCGFAFVFKFLGKLWSGNPRQEWRVSFNFHYFFIGFLTFHCFFFVFPDLLIVSIFLFSGEQLGNIPRAITIIACPAVCSLGCHRPPISGLRRRCRLQCSARGRTMDRPDVCPRGRHPRLSGRFIWPFTGLWQFLNIHQTR